MLALKNVSLFFVIFCFVSFCVKSTALGAEEVSLSPYAHMKGEDVLNMLKKHNEVFQKRAHNFADVSPSRIQETAKGQHPYAVIVTCSDSRTPPEHIFNAGLGELFVIRNAGNSIDNKELASIEYAVTHLHTKLIVVMGHSHCGAVEAALDCTCEGTQKTYLQQLIHTLHTSLQGEKDARKAEKRNVQNSMQKILDTVTIQKRIHDGSVLVRGALYNVESGVVEFLDP